MKRYLLVLAVVLAVAGCTSQKSDYADKVWTEPELKALQGKTRDEVREALGEPKGLYTFDSKDRWHYSKVLLVGGQPGAVEEVALLIYFSKFGEHRVTIIEIRRRAEE
jgi:outer membrane protein assembly factor BamE (lipoprotein component of BamABCDE complex)